MTKKTIKHYKTYLENLTEAVTSAIKNLEETMNEPSTVERGRRIARIINYLEFANDRAKHFGLGLPLQKKTALTSRSS